MFCYFQQNLVARISYVSRIFLNKRIKLKKEPLKKKTVLDAHHFLPVGRAPDLLS